MDQPIVSGRRRSSRAPGPARAGAEPGEQPHDNSNTGKSGRRLRKVPSGGSAGASRKSQLAKPKVRSAEHRKQLCEDDWGAEIMATPPSKRACHRLRCGSMEQFSKRAALPEGPLSLQEVCNWPNRIVDQIAIRPDMLARLLTNMNAVCNVISDYSGVSSEAEILTQVSQAMDARGLAKPDGPRFRMMRVCDKDPRCIDALHHRIHKGPFTHGEC